MDYPHFVQKESDFIKEHHRFVGSYMPDEDVRIIKETFPNGCNNHLNLCTIPFRDSSPEEYLRDKQDLESLKELWELEKKNQCLLWAWQNLLHEGYWPLFDANLNLVCCKGHTKPNRHTKIKLLKKVPAKVQELWNELQDFIYSAIEIAETSYLRR